MLRWRCRSCHKTFSSATGALDFQHKKRHLLQSIRDLLCSSVSQRRIARVLGIHRGTVARQVFHLSLLARFNHIEFLRCLVLKPFAKFQFDEMETFEHSKLKPLSIALAVSEGSRKILGFQVASMPANGLLAERSRQKYGPRPDERAHASRLLFDSVAVAVAENALVTSDQNPKYPRWLRGRGWEHVQVKGRRGCIVGQGELKKIGFDPLFSLNHTCAMIRDNIKQLSRRTWCTTKKADCLTNLLWVYLDFHNQVLTK